MKFMVISYLNINFSSLMSYFPTSLSTGLEYVLHGKHNENSGDEDSDDTLVDGVSIASSCGTYISEGGDIYKCARNEFVFKHENEHELIDFGELVCTDTNSIVPVIYGRYIHILI